MMESHLDSLGALASVGLVWRASHPLTAVVCASVWLRVCCVGLVWRVASTLRPSGVGCIIVGVDLVVFRVFRIIASYQRSEVQVCV